MNGVKFKEDIEVQAVVDEIDCITVYADTKISKKMSAYGLIQKDLGQCLYCLDEILKLPNSDDSLIVRWALYVAFHTTYGKCFNMANGRKIKLEFKDHVPKKYEKAHEKIMILRNNYTAHAGGYEEKAIVAVGLNPDEQNKEVLGVVGPLALFVSHITEYDIKIYMELTKSIKKVVELKIERLREQVFQEMKEMDIDYLYQNA